MKQGRELGFGCAIAVVAVVWGPARSAFAQRSGEASAQASPPEEGAADPAPQAPAPSEPAPLPPVEPGAWGVGGKDEEGRFAPRGKTGALKAAEEEEREAKRDEGPLMLPPPGSVAIDTVFGFGDIRVATNDKDPTDVFIVSLLASATYRFGDTWAVGLRFPFSTGSSTGPGGANDDFSTFALGNLEAAVRPTFAIGRRVKLPVSLAVALPLASGDYLARSAERGSIGQAVANQSAASARGWEDNALFASKRLGIVPSLGFGYDAGAAHFAAFTKLELMLKVAGQDPGAFGENTEAKLQNPNTSWVTGASFFYGFLNDRLAPGLRAWLTVFTQPMSVSGVDYSGAQFVLEPQVQAKQAFGASGAPAITGALGYVLPVSGHLGGVNAASTSGLRVRAGVLF